MNKEKVLEIVNDVISNLPDWLKPELGKNNSHYKEFTKTKSRFLPSEINGLSINRKRTE